MATTLSRKPDRSSLRTGPEPLRAKPRQLPFPLNLYQTAVGKKWVMALTGIGLVSFVVAHMLGNLHLYEGPIPVAEYSETLRKIGADVVPHTWFLWILRIGLVVMFVLHIHSAVTLSHMSRVSNPRSSLDGNKRYPGGQDYIAVNFASRTMRWTGPIIALFLVYHLADLTWGLLPWVDYQRGDPYHNLVQSLENWPVAILYIVANVALALHIFHGVYSLFQSLGVNSPKLNALRRPLAGGVALLILVGNLSFPIAVQAGVIDEDNCTAPCGITGLQGQEATP
jgi:succinate dehydrogenase / fumarate reductase, cytochrome b subunit